MKFMHETTGHNRLWHSVCDESEGRRIARVCLQFLFESMAGAFDGQEVITFSSEL